MADADASVQSVTAAATMAPREIWRVLAPFRRLSIVVIALVIVDTALASVGVGIVLPVLQAVLDGEHRSAIVSRFFPAFDRLSADVRVMTLALGAVAVFLAKGAIGMMTVVNSHRLLQRLRFHWVNEIGVAYMRGAFGRYAFRKQGELFNDWFNETLSATRFFQAYLTYASSLALVSALVVLGVVVNWRAMLGLLVLYAAVAMIVKRTLYAQSSNLSARKLRFNQALSGGMVEDLANLRDIKLMHAEAARLRHLADRSDQLGRIFLRSAVVGEVPRVISETVAVTLLMTMVIIGALVMRIRAEVMFPMIVFFSVVAYRLVSAASQMMGARIRALNEAHSLRRVEQAASEAHEQEDLVSGEPMQRIETDIAFSNVDYAYAGDALVIADATAVIPHGKVTFLVGPSGAGKSTLLDLLLRLLEPNRGSIHANGRNISEFRLADWRRAFGYVSQDVSLFNGSLRMNLLLARPEATDAELREVCRLAGADSFIDLLPEGYDTNVGDRGYGLSGGQRKRIAIARALIGKPSVLILDEATTSFEQSLEREMLRGLRAALPELTIIQVTHRLQSLQDADWIVALEAGRVTACGPAERLAAPFSAPQT